MEATNPKMYFQMLRYIQRKALPEIKKEDAKENTKTKNETNKTSKKNKTTTQTKRPFCDGRETST